MLYLCQACDGPPAWWAMGERRPMEEERIVNHSSIWVTAKLLDTTANCVFAGSETKKKFYVFNFVPLGDFNADKRVNTG